MKLGQSQHLDNFKMLALAIKRQESVHGEQPAQGGSRHCVVLIILLFFLLVIPKFSANTLEGYNLAMDISIRFLGLLEQITTHLMT